MLQLRRSMRHRRAALHLRRRLLMAKAPRPALARCQAREIAAPPCWWRQTRLCHSAVRPPCRRPAGFPADPAAWCNALPRACPATYWCPHTTRPAQPLPPTRGPNSCSQVLPQFGPARMLRRPKGATVPGSACGLRRRRLKAAAAGVAAQPAARGHRAGVALGPLARVGLGPGHQLRPRLEGRMGGHPHAERAAVVVPHAVDVLDRRVR